MLSCCQHVFFLTIWSMFCCRACCVATSMFDAFCPFYSLLYVLLCGVLCCCQHVCCRFVLLFALLYYCTVSSIVGHWVTACMFVVVLPIYCLGYSLCCRDGELLPACLLLFLLFHCIVWGMSSCLRFSQHDCWFFWSSFACWVAGSMFVVGLSFYLHCLAAHFVGLSLKCAI